MFGPQFRYFRFDRIEKRNNIRTIVREFRTVVHFLTLYAYNTNRELEDRNYPGRVINVVVSCAASSGISTDAIIQRGAVVASMIDAIEYAGHRVEVVCNSAASGSSSYDSRNGQNKEQGWFEVSVVIKKASQPLDLADLAFCIMNPAMFRRIMFSAAELNNWSDLYYHYGYPAEATNKGDIYIPASYLGDHKSEDIMDFVLTELKKLGVDIESNT